MMLAGMIVGVKNSDSLTWYDGLVRSPAAMVMAGCIGFALERVSLALLVTWKNENGGSLITYDVSVFSYLGDTSGIMQTCANAESIEVSE